MVAVAVSVAVAATVSAYAASAASTRARGGSQVLDRTYSCQVRAQHYFDFQTSVNLPPTPAGFQRPGQVWLDTAGKAVPQFWFRALPNSLKVDGSACRASSRRVTLKPTGLGTGTTVTPSLFGQLNGRCGTTKRVLVHFRITMQSGTPEKALVAIRNGDHKSKPVAFFNWRPLKMTGYLGHSCH